MDEYVGVAHLVESRFERVDQMCGQFAYEADSVGQQKRQVVDDDLAHCGVECCEKLVLGKHLAFGKKVHERRLPYVGVADERHAREFAAVFALHRFLLVDGCELVFEP